MAYGHEKSNTEIIRLAKRVFEMMGKNGGDIIYSSKLSSLEDMDRIRVTKGVENIEVALKKGKGVIFLVGHIGAFEFLATDMALRGYKPHVIGTPLKDKKLNDLLWKQRNRLGAAIIERGKETIRLIRNLKSGGTVVILIDQDTRVKSRFVNFFGIPCATPIGATVLASKTGAAVVPAFIHLRETDYLHEINFYPEVELTFTGNEEEDLVTNTQTLTDVIEAEVRRHPEQWVWIHERWKTKPGNEIT
jgi:KDO2-lipid IV(A) lauroyltransferase